MVVLGIDPGAKTGWAVTGLPLFNSSGLPPLKYGTVKGKEATGDYWRSARSIISTAAVLGCGTMAIEVSPFSRFPSMLKSLHRRVGGWCAIATVLGLDVVEVAPRTWQTALVWPGKQPKHAQMAAAYMLAAESRWGVPLSEDEAAAAFVALYVSENIDELRDSP